MKLKEKEKYIRVCHQKKIILFPSILLNSMVSHNRIEIFNKKHK